MNEQISLQVALRHRMTVERTDEKKPTHAASDALVRMVDAKPQCEVRELDGSSFATASSSNKRPRIDDQGDSPLSASPDNSNQTGLKSPLLHQTCRLFANCAPVIESALEMEPQAACKRAECARKGNSSSFLVGDTKVPYSLPINILLHENASIDAIKLMAEKAPQALLMKDGRDECCSLIIALRLHGRSSQKQEDEAADNAEAPLTNIEAILAADPTAAQHHDKKRNLPLHVAAYVGSSCCVIQKLCDAYPEALLEVNFYGETPLDICIRNGKCSERAGNYLQEKVNHLKLARLRGMAPP